MMQKKPHLLLILSHLDYGADTDWAIAVGTFLVQVGWKVEILSLGGYFSHRLERVGIREVLLPTYPKNLFHRRQVRRFLNHFIRKESPSIVHFIGSEWVHVGGSLSTRYPQHAFVLTPYHNKRTVPKESKLKILPRFPLLKILGTSQASLQELAQVRAIDHQRLEAVGWGINLEHYDRRAILVEQTLELAGRLGIPEVTRLLAHIVSETNSQTYKLFIKVLSQLEMQKNYLGMIILPKPLYNTLYPQVLKTIKKYSFPNGIPIVVEGEMSPRVIFSLIYGLVTGLDGRGAMGSFLLEAQAMRCAAVSLKGGGVEEIVEDGKTGFLATNEDSLKRAIERLLNLDEEAYVKLVALAHDKVAERFELQKQLHQQKAYYEALPEI